MILLAQNSITPLILAASLTAAAALAHFMCLVFGAPAFRLLGAGEPIARMAENGHWYPPVIAFVIGSVLTLWVAYALGAAGLIAPLPLTRYALWGIATFFLLRAVCFPLLIPAFPGNSMLSWWSTSVACLILGVAYLIGAWNFWTTH